MGREKKVDNRPKEGTPNPRIGRLDERTMGYYRRVEDKLKEGFDEHEEDKSLFLDNVFGELKKEAIQVSQNQTASRIVEHLLQEANIYQLVGFVDALSRDWELVCTDRFVSHVTETALKKLGILIQTETNMEIYQSILAEAFDHFLELYGFLMSNLAFHMQHTYTSHIVRNMIQLLGGVFVGDSVRNTQLKVSKDQSVQFQPDQRFLNLLSAMCDKMISLPKLEDHVLNSLSSPVIQTTLFVLQNRDPKYCKKLCKALIACSGLLDTSTPENESRVKSLPEIMQHPVGSHMVEVLLRVCDIKLFNKVLVHLQPCLMTIALHPVAYFIAGTLIRSSPTEDQFEIIFKTLSHHLEDLLGLNHTKLIIDLAAGCIKHGIKQDRLLKALMKAFHCYEPAERQVKCVPLFASLIAYETFYKLPTKVADEDEGSSSEDELEIPKLSAASLQGSLLLQQLLHFGNPKLIVSSLLNLSTSEILALSCDRFGNHVMEVFTSCDTVGEKSRDALYSKLKGHYVELACDKHGSRTLDAILANGSMKNRIAIAEEMSKHISKLQSHIFGKFACYKLNLPLFLRDHNKWKIVQQQESGKRKIMQELLEEGGLKARKKKRTYEESSNPKEDKTVGETDEAVDDDMNVIELKTRRKSITTTPDAEAQTKLSPNRNNSEIVGYSKKKNKRKKAK